LLTHDEIIAGCIKNDRKAQKALFEKFAPKMFGYCLRYAESKDDAQDVLQEGFIKVFEKINTLKDVSQLEGWMTRIFINIALSKFRKKRSGPEFVDVNQADLTLDSPEEENTLSTLSQSQVMDMMAKLPENYRVILNLYAIDGLSHKEICELLNVTESNSKSILSRARKMMRDMINQIPPQN